MLLAKPYLATELLQKGTQPYSDERAAIFGVGSGVLRAAIGTLDFGVVPQPGIIVCEDVTVYTSEPQPIADLVRDYPHAVRV